MADQPTITPEMCRQLLRYEPETGKLYWRERAAAMFKSGKRTAVGICNNWNAANAGKEAFTAVGQRGRRFGTISGSVKLAHRVIWAMVHGEWPKQIDHINGDPSDNRLCNLRNVTDRENTRNKAVRPNASGHVGVHWFKPKGKWRARIGGARGNERHLGYFDSKADAIAARQAAEQEEEYHPNHARRPLHSK